MAWDGIACGKADADIVLRRGIIIPLTVSARSRGAKGVSLAWQARSALPLNVEQSRGRSLIEALPVHAWPSSTDEADLTINSMLVCAATSKTSSYVGLSFGPRSPTSTNAQALIHILVLHLYPALSSIL